MGENKNVPIDLFLEIVSLYNAKIAALQAELADALADDEADELAINEATNLAAEWQQKAEESAKQYADYLTKDNQEDTALLDVMNQIKASLVGT